MGKFLALITATIVLTLCTLAVADVWYRVPGTYSIPEQPQPLGLSIEGSLTVAYGSPWDFRITVTGGKGNAVLTTSSAYPPGISVMSDRTSLTFSGRMKAGTYGPFSVIASEGAEAEALSFSVVVEEPNPPFQLIAPLPASLVVPSGGTANITIAADGGYGDYEFFLAGGTAPFSYSAQRLADRSGYRVTATAPDGTYGPFVVSARDELGTVRSSAPFSVRFGD